jgi:hypothetical protein
MNEPNKILAPLGGLALDLLALIRNRPFVPHSLTKLRNIVFCGKVTGADTVIEIGSYKGVTARRLSKRFRRVVSIEIASDLHEQAKQTCKGRSNVELLLGDGTVLLPQVAAAEKNAVLFLDGHFSGGETGLGDEPEPVLKELDLILPYLDSFRAVVVDDFRLFGVEDGWPAKSVVLAKLERVLPSPFWTHYILNDQYVCIRRDRA